MRLIWLDVIYLKHKRKLVDVTKRDVHVLANQTFIICPKNITDRCSVVL